MSEEERETGAGVPDTGKFSWLSPGPVPSGRKAAGLEFGGWGGLTTQACVGNPVARIQVPAPSSGPGLVTSGGGVPPPSGDASSPHRPCCPHPCHHHPPRPARLQLYLSC